MYRMELKGWRLSSKISTYLLNVPNVPYGVERVVAYTDPLEADYSASLFLMYRMELKETPCLKVHGFLDGVPNVPYGVESDLSSQPFSCPAQVPNVPYGVESPDNPVDVSTAGWFLLYRMELKDLRADSFVSPYF